MRGITPHPLAWQETCWLITPELHAVRCGKDLLFPQALPIAIKQPVTRLAGMALASPGDEPLFEQVIIAAQKFGLDHAVIVGDPPHNQRVEIPDDLRLGSGLRLL